MSCPGNRWDSPHEVLLKICKRLWEDRVHFRFNPHEEPPGLRPDLRLIQGTLSSFKRRLSKNTDWN